MSNHDLQTAIREMRQILGLAQAGVRIRIGLLSDGPGEGIDQAPPFANGYEEEGERSC